MPNDEDIIETTEDDDEDEDQSWVLDSLVGFLKSPLWSSSLNNFVDQMSVGKLVIYTDLTYLKFLFH